VSARVKAGALLGLAFGACVSEDVADGQFTCFHPGSKSECPDGLVCATDLYCRKSVAIEDAGTGIGGDGSWISGGTAGVPATGGTAGTVSTGGTGGSEPVCGNNVREGNEVCDPCNCDDGDGCTNDYAVGPCAGCAHPSACQSNQVCVSGSCRSVACVRRLWKGSNGNVTHWFGLAGTSPPGTGWTVDSECDFRVYTSPEGGDQAMYTFENSDNGITRYRYRVANDNLGALWFPSTSALGGFSSTTARPGEVPLYLCWQPCCAKTAHVFGDHILTRDVASCAGWQTEDNYPAGFGINRWVLPP
jgi:hypothetical protein